MLRKIVFGFLISNFLLFSCKPMNPLQTNLGKLKGSLNKLKIKLGTLNTKLGGLKENLGSERVFDPTTINDKTKEIFIEDEHQQRGVDSWSTIFDSSSKIIIRNNQSLEKLRIQSRAANDLTEVIIENNPKLIEVKIDGVYKEGLKKLKKITLSGNGNLALHISELEKLIDLEIKGQVNGLFLNSLPELNKILLDDQSKLENIALEFLPKLNLPDSWNLLHNPVIKNLTLRKLDCFTLNDVKNIVEQLPNLELLSLISLKGNGVVEFDLHKNPKLKLVLSGQFEGVDKIVLNHFQVNQFQLTIDFSVSGPLIIELKSDKLYDYYQAVMDKTSLISISCPNMDRGFGLNGVNVEKDKITIKILK